MVNWKFSGIIMQFFVFCFYILIVLNVLISFSLAENSIKKDVDILLVSNFERGRFLYYEAMEAIFDMSPNDYWRMVGSYNASILNRHWNFEMKWDNDTLDSNLTSRKDWTCFEECQWEYILSFLHQKEGTTDTSDVDMNMLEWSLATRYYIPRLQFFLQMNSLFRNFSEISPNMVCEQSPKLKPLSTMSHLLPITYVSTSLEYFEHDHEYLLTNFHHKEMVTCILYSEYSEKLSEIHNLLVEQLQYLTSSELGIRYILRPVFAYDWKEPKKKTLENLVEMESLQGYLAELQIKNMEYKSQQDPLDNSNSKLFIHGINFESLTKEYPSLTNLLKKFTDNLANRKSQERINVWDMRNVGIQVTHDISQQKDLKTKLEILKQASQNFPDEMDRLVKIKYPSEITRKLAMSQKLHSFPEGKTSLFINGMPLDLEKLSIYTLYDIFYSELKLMKEFKEIWFQNVKKDSLQKKFHQFLFERDKIELIRPRLRIFHTEEEQSYVMYLNNIVSDERYTQFSTDFRNLNILPGGRFNFIRKNILEAIFFVDLSNLNHFNVIQGVLSLLNQGYPIRIGFVFLPMSREIVKPGVVEVDITGATSNIAAKASIEYDIAATLYHISKHYSLDIFFSFLFRTLMPSLRTLRDIDLNQLLKSHPLFRKDENLKQFSFIRDEYNHLYSMLKERGLDAVKSPLLIFNGVPTVIDYQHPGTVVQNLYSSIQKEIPVLQKLIREKAFSDKDIQLQKIIYERLFSISKYEPSIFTNTPLYMDIDQIKELEEGLKEYPLVTVNEQDGNPIEFTYSLCIDFNNPSQYEFITKLLTHVSKKQETGSKNTKVAIYHFGNALRGKGRFLNRELGSIFSKIRESSDLIHFNELMLEDRMHFTEHEIEKEGLKEYYTPFCPQWNDAILTHKKVNFEEEISPEQDVAILSLNGRLLQITKDFDLFEALETQASNLVKFAKRLQENAQVTISLSQFISVISSDVIRNNRIAPFTYKRNQQSLDNCDMIGCIENQISTIKYPLVHGVLNPLSEHGAIYSEVIFQLYQKFQLPLQIILNPIQEYTSLPLKSWYRFHFAPKLSFNNKGREQNFLHFNGIDAKEGQVFTMNIHTPETWLLSTVHADYDLDNINLSNVDGDRVLTIFELQHIILTGSCYEDNHNPARALQLYLDTPFIGNHTADTMVMQNFGYFQLKANPGMHQVYIASGWHQELYKIHDYAITDFYKQNKNLRSISNNCHDECRPTIVVAHFEGPMVFLRVKRRLSNDRRSIFDDPSKKVSLKRKPKDSIVNIFTVASGHLYERLMRIMMLSVVRNTSRSRVKFWILGNYLSPHFQKILPQMASKYDFDYGIVTYKWPTWLFKQKEKQRLIWAYKILFLDVLFPINVDRVIFVDADQVSRTDMTELAEMDIKHHAVAYTPFCSDKPEMHKYAFWRGGYWKNHLRNKPYHISALYLVDIPQMRKQSAADQYRTFYDSLSRDPNSLANLDQDLPNYAQHSVPIYSLPQEWLWCETWCSQASKSKAKTIDLCNNPETKEHKTVAARRIIPEWERYDKEVNEDFMMELETNKNTGHA